MFYLFLIVCFFFNDTATTEIYTLSLHDALPISTRRPARRAPAPGARASLRAQQHRGARPARRGAGAGEAWEPRPDLHRFAAPSARPRAARAGPRGAAAEGAATGAVRLATAAEGGSVAMLERGHSRRTRPAARGWCIESAP